MAKGRFKNPVEAVLTGVKDFNRRKDNVRELTAADRFDGKTVLLTGANSGVGFAIAEQVARRGGRLLMACRGGHPEAGDKIRALTGSDQVEMLRVDLSDTASIHRLADELRARGEQLDVVFCNAGVATPNARRSPQGLDEMFMVNYVAKFILLNRLLQDGTIPNAVYAGEGRPGGEPRPRIVFTSSDSHRNSDPIDFDELGEWQEYGVNGGISRYSYYKLVLNTFATELSRRLNPNGGADVAVHAVCPGPVNTNIVRDAPPLLRAFLRFIFTFTFQSPAKAAPPLVYMGCAAEEEGMTNEYLHMRTRRPMDEKCYDPEAGRRLWEKTEELVRGMV